MATRHDAADDVVTAYLGAVATQDWDRLRSTVADDVVRVGPFGDVYTGREAYVGFLSALLPTLPGYVMNVTRVTYVEDGRKAFAELSETVTMNGEARKTPEVLMFNLDDAGRVSRVEVFTRRA